MKNQERKFVPSLFSGVWARDCRNSQWDEIVSIINGPALKDATEKYRQFIRLGLNSDADAVKKHTLAFIPAVQCNGGRKSENFVGLTFVGLCDFDHLADIDSALTLARADAHAMLVYRTISGNGVRVLFRYVVDDVPDDAALPINKVYVRAFSIGNEYFSSLLGAEADGQCKNVGRLSVMCHDADAVLNAMSEPFHISYGECVPASRPKRNTYVRKAVALPRAVKAVEERLAISGVVYDDGSHNAYICRAGYYLNKLGVPSDDAAAWAVGRFVDMDEQYVRSTFASCYTHTEEHGSLRITELERANRSDRGDAADSKSVFASVAEIEEFLLTQAAFRFNIITRKTEIKMTSGASSDAWTELTDRDVNTLWARMCKTGQQVRNISIHNVISSEFVEAWNPFEGYFSSLPEWDGKTDYIGELTDMVRVKISGDDADRSVTQERFRDCFRKWIVASVAAFFNTDVVNNVILVLIGRQGIYKTTFFNHLLPPELRRYFYTKTNSDRMTKDDKLSLAEYAVICLEEIDSMKTPELNQLKAMMTNKTVNERAAYERYKEDRVHIASFCGTGNNIQFLTDQTGNRRWLPFEVESIKDPHLHKYNYEGIYSQAYALWQREFCYWFTQRDIDALISHISHFEVPRIEEELIMTYYRLPEQGEHYILLNATNIIEHINIYIKRALSVVKVGLAMKKLGFEQQRFRYGRMFKVVERTGAEIAMMRNKAEKIY